jgi:hypothetical protein
MLRLLQGAHTEAAIGEAPGTPDDMHLKCLLYSQSPQLSPCILRPLAILHGHDR